MDSPISLTHRLVLRTEFQEGKSQGKTAPAPKTSEEPTAPAGTKAAPPQGKGQPKSMLDACGTQQILLMVGMLVIFYLLLIRPQQKQEKARRAMLSAIKKGDKVATSGGIHGVITNLSDTTATIRVDSDSNTKLRVDRDHIGRVIVDEQKGGAGAQAKGKAS